MGTLENFLSEKGLIRISSIDEVSKPSMFLIDTSYKKNKIQDTCLAIYPLAKNKNITHDLLNLYGTHWSYLTDIANWEDIKKREGDSKEVL